MEIGEISSRYARALYSLAKEKEATVEVYENMKMLRESFMNHRELMTILSNPMVMKDDKQRLLKEAGGIQVNPLFENFIHLTVEKRREECLPFMATSFIRLYREEQRITRVEFSAPVKLDLRTEAHLKAKLNEETGNTIEFEGRVAPELLGGFRLRIGNSRIDASYKTELEDIRKELRSSI